VLLIAVSYQANNNSCARRMSDYLSDVMQCLSVCYLLQTVGLLSAALCPLSCHRIFQSFQSTNYTSQMLLYLHFKNISCTRKETKHIIKLEENVRIKYPRRYLTPFPLNLYRKRFYLYKYLKGKYSLRKYLKISRAEEVLEISSRINILPT
jgi:hypothetical protein